MYVLKDLWRGKISPIETSVIPSKSQKELMAQINKESKFFLQELSDESREHFDKYEALVSERQFCWGEMIFVEAFRLGAKMMLDILTEESTEG